MKSLRLPISRTSAAQKHWVLKISDPNVLSEMDSVFVTLEKANDGNENVPAGKKLLSAYLGGPPITPNIGSKITVPCRGEGAGRCSGCGAIFELDNPKRKYCSKECREKEKHKRWRERDPERARAANARYYARHYFGSLDKGET
jgi:hypothetical protein